jgi:hypothetical protein
MGWFKKCLELGLTITGSVKDILEGFPWAKSAVTLLQELLDRFKEKD